MRKFIFLFVLIPLSSFAYPILDCYYLNKRIFHGEVTYMIFNQGYLFFKDKKSKHLYVTDSSCLVNKEKI